MLSGKCVSNILICISVLIAGCHSMFLLASDRPEEERQQIAQVDSNRANSGATATKSSEIEELRRLIEAQRLQIEKLQSTVEQQQRNLDKAMSAINAIAAPTGAPAESSATPTVMAKDTPAEKEKLDDTELIKGELEAVADNAAQTNQRLTKLESDTAANKKETDAKAKQLGNFTFSGDIRARVEPFFQDGAETRTRERFRLRFNVTGKVSDEFSGGFSLATGSLDDPVSTNQSLTGFFNRKSFAIDKAYITYQPKYAQFLKLDGGRFAHPWYRTPMTFDNDVNVEGAAETFSFNSTNSVFKNFTVVTFQLPINEVAARADSYVLGGQIQSQFQLSPKLRMGLYGGYIDVLRADPIAVALGGSLRPSLPNSNSLRRNDAGVVVGYANKYAYLDTIMKIDFDASAQLPVSFVFNFVNNVRGSRERSGYWTELMFGKTKSAKDIQFGYLFTRIEKDAVIGAWNESDLRSSTNVLNHRLSFAYLIKGNVTGQVTAWIGKLYNPWDNTDLVVTRDFIKCSGDDKSDCRDNYLKRFQFDLIYKF